VALLLQGKVDANGAQIAGLDLTASDKQSLKLTGKSTGAKASAPRRKSTGWTFRGIASIRDR
jgi:translocation and assembly module TamB